MEGKVSCCAANVCTDVLPVLPGLAELAIASCLPSPVLFVTCELACSVSCVHQLFSNTVYSTVCCGEASTLICTVTHGIFTAYAQLSLCSRHLHAHKLQCSVSSVHQLFSNIPRSSTCYAAVFWRCLQMRQDLCRHPGCDNPYVCRMTRLQLWSAQSLMMYASMMLPSCVSALCASQLQHVPGFCRCNTGYTACCMTHTTAEASHYDSQDRLCYQRSSAASVNSVQVPQLRQL